MTRFTKTPEDISELTRLYVDERLSINKIAKLFGTSKQGIHHRFRSSGLNLNDLKALRPAPPPDDEMARDLHELIAVQRIPRYIAARQLGISILAATRITKRLDIRRPRASSKFPELNHLKVGEYIEVPATGNRSQDYARFISTGRYLGIKLSARRLNDQIMRVTRIG